MFWFFVLYKFWKVFWKGWKLPLKMNSWVGRVWEQVGQSVFWQDSVFVSPAYFFTCFDCVSCCWPVHHFRFCLGRYSAAKQNRAAIMIFIVPVTVTIKVYSIFLLWLCRRALRSTYKPHNDMEFIKHYSSCKCNPVIIKHLLNIKSQMHHLWPCVCLCKHTASINCMNSELLNNPKALTVINDKVEQPWHLYRRKHYLASPTVSLCPHINRKGRKTERNGDYQRWTACLTSALTINSLHSNLKLSLGKLGCIWFRGWDNCNGQDSTLTYKKCDLTS